MASSLFTSQRKSSIVRVAKIFAIVGYLLTCAIGTTLQVHAQEAAEIDSHAAAVSAGDTGSVDFGDLDESSPESEQAAARRLGCPTGNVDDKAEGAGDFDFVLGPRGNLKYFFFFWNQENFAQGRTMNASISSKRINFMGSAGKDCSVTGSGAGEDWNLSGKYKFHGKCAKFFQGGTFSISDPPIICISTFNREKKWQASNSTR